MPEAFVISLCCAACDPVSHMVATSAASCCCFVHLRCRLALTQDQRLHRRSPTCPNLEDPVERQVPLSISEDFSKYRTETAKYHYDCGRQDRTNKYPDDRRDRQVPLSPTCTTTPRSHVNDYMDTTSSSPKRVPLPTTLDIYETNVYNYRRRVQRLPLRRVRLLPTTTRERLPPLRPVNDYFLYETRSAPNARFEGITAENDRRGPNACVV